MHSKFVAFFCLGLLHLQYLYILSLADGEFLNEKVNLTCFHHCMNTTATPPTNDHTIINNFSFITYTKSKIIPYNARTIHHLHEVQNYPIQYKNQSFLSPQSIQTANTALCDLKGMHDISVSLLIQPVCI